MSAEKTFLFLQSHPSLFGRDVVRYMRSLGASCRILNLSLADWGYRVGLGADNYQGRLKGWDAFLQAYVERHAITDIVYYADQRPYHRTAYRIARERGLNAYAYEFGYIRPDWITLERGAMGPYSHFPNDPEMIHELAAGLDFEVPATRYPYTFFDEAFNEVAYNLLPVFLPVFFPFYQRDRYYHPLVDYPNYLPRLWKRRSNNQKAQQKLDRLLQGDFSYFVVPMQMQNDYQVRNHAGYGHLSEMVEEIMVSFARASRQEQRLVFKIHPLDNNMERWPRTIRRCAEKHRCDDRVMVIDGGNLAELYQHSQGVVLLNSTAGIQALSQGVPVKVLGVPVYDIVGMTCQKPLDDFWKEPTQPDAALVADFVKLLAASIQVKGNFFSREGRAKAVPEFSRRLLEGDVNRFGAYVETPPRLEQARARGVPIPADSYWHQDR